MSTEGSLHCYGEGEHDCETALHVRRSQPRQDVVFDLRYHVSATGNGVEGAPQEALSSPSTVLSLRRRCRRSSSTFSLRHSAEVCFDDVRERRLVVTDRKYRDDLRSESQKVGNR